MNDYYNDYSIYGICYNNLDPFYFLSFNYYTY